MAVALPPEETTTKVTNGDIAHLRLRHQRIAGPKLASPAEVVRWLGAMQAQDYRQALWAIGLRMRQATVAAVEQAIADRAVVRTWPMRGTLHFVPPEDAKWMLRLSASRMIAADRRRQEQLGLDEAILDHCAQLFHDALGDGKRLTRSAMMRVLADAGINTKNQRGYHILWYTAQTGLICLGPMHDNEQTFVLLDEWVPHSRALSREESLAELAVRYFMSHGPATVHDFAWWAGLPVADAKAGLAAAEPKLTSVEVDGRAHWMASDAPRQTYSEQPGIYLLPGFDEYLLGYKDRSAVLPREHAGKVVPGGNGVFSPMIVVDGQIVGSWKQKRTKLGIGITASAFARIGDVEERIMEAATGYGDFLGLPVSTASLGASH